jgi:hypothetical protein
MLCLLIIGNKVDNHNKDFMWSFLTSIDRMCEWLINKLANEGCTYIVMVFSTKLSKTFSTKAFLDGKTPCGHNLHDNLCWSYVDSIVIMWKNFLTKNNIKSSKKPNYVGSSFLNLLKIKKTLKYCRWRYKCPLFASLLIKCSSC